MRFSPRKLEHSGQASKANGSLPPAECEAFTFPPSAPGLGGIPRWRVVRQSGILRSFYELTANKGAFNRAESL